MVDIGRHISRERPSKCIFTLVLRNSQQVKLMNWNSGIGGKATFTYFSYICPEHCNSAAKWCYFLEITDLGWYTGQSASPQQWRKGISSPASTWRWLAQCTVRQRNAYIFNLSKQTPTPGQNTRTIEPSIIFHIEESQRKMTHEHNKYIHSTRSM